MPNKGNSKDCLFCSGSGYVTVFLGGSETCPDCNGKESWKASIVPCELQENMEEMQSQAV